MQTLKHLSTKTPIVSIINNNNRIPKPVFNFSLNIYSHFSATSNKGEEEWNDAWESAWLPDDLNPTTHQRAPWETDVNFTTATTTFTTESDADTKAFVEDMNENWDERRNSKSKSTTKSMLDKKDDNSSTSSGNSNGDGYLYSLENIKKDYRVKKQRIHAGLWMKEIEKMEEAKLGDFNAASGDVSDGIEKLLGSCSEIFDTTNNDLENAKIPSSSEFKNKPDGWETTSKAQDGNVWEMTQREEDILLQEFDRRTAYCKFQIASFIKTHIFSRRRPIDGWKYMIEEIGPNARKGKGSVSRVPSLSDASTQPFKEEKTPIGSSLTPSKLR